MTINEHTLLVFPKLPVHAVKPTACSGLGDGILGSAPQSNCGNERVVDPVTKYSCCPLALRQTSHERDSALQYILVIDQRAELCMRSLHDRWELTLAKKILCPSTYTSTAMAGAAVWKNSAARELARLHLALASQELLKVNTDGKLAIVVKDYALLSGCNVVIFLKLFECTLKLLSLTVDQVAHIPRKSNGGGLKVGIFIVRVILNVDRRG